MKPLKGIIKMNNTKKNTFQNNKSIYKTGEKAEQGKTYACMNCAEPYYALNNDKLPQCKCGCNNWYKI